MPQRLPDNFAILHCGTSGTWTLEELQNLLRTLDRAYGLLLAVSLATARVSESSQLRKGWAPLTLAEYVSKSFPSDTFRPGEPWQPSPEPQFITTGAQDFPFGPEIRYLNFLFEQRALLAPTAQPRVVSWQMSSPARIQVAGLADLVRELRELVKDLRYRNRQEEELGDLEIARKRLDLNQAPLSPAAGDYVALQVLKEVRILRDLEDRKFLVVGDTVDSVVQDICDSLDRLAPEWAQRDRIVKQLRSLTRMKLPAVRKAMNKVAEGLTELLEDDKLGHEEYVRLIKRLDDLYYARVRAA